MTIKPRIKKDKNYFYIGINVKNMETGKYQFKRLDNKEKYANEKDAKKALKQWQAKYELGLSKESDIKNQDLTFKDVLDEYLVVLENKVKTKELKSATQKIFKEKIVHARPIYFVPIKEFRYKKQLEFQNLLIEKGVSNMTINIVREKMKKVFDYAQKMEYIEHGLLVEKLHEPKPEKKVLTRDQLQSVFDHTKTKLKTIVNNQLHYEKCDNTYTELEFIIKVAYYHCLRAKDWFYLKWDDVDFEQNIINVPATAKNKLAKKVPLHQETIDIMKYFKEIAKNDYLNPLLDTNKTHTQNIDHLSKKITRLGKRANLPFRLNLTIIRATSATHYAESGQLSAIELNQLFGIQADMTEKDKKLIEFTGHTNTKTTSNHYVDVMNKDNQKKLTVKVRKALK